MLVSVAGVKFATKATSFPSGIQHAEATSNSPVVSCLGLPPRESTTKTCFLVSWNQPVVVNLYQRCFTILTSLLWAICSLSTLTRERKSTFFPSGDHWGLSTDFGITQSADVRPLPMSRTLSLVTPCPDSPETKSTFFPSGDQDGLWLI